MGPVNNNKVLCVGLCCLDIVMVCKSYPKEDSDQRCLSHKWQRGGNASNSATVFAEFGIPCEILGTLSTDIGGQFMKNDFKLHTISFENCHFYEEYESPVSIVWISAENGSRTIVHSNKYLSHKWQRGGNASNSATVFAEFGIPCEILGTLSTDIGSQFMNNDFKLRNISFENCHFYEEYESPVSTVWISAENGSRTILHSNKPYYEEIKSMIRSIRRWNEDHAGNGIRISIEIEKPRVELISLGDVVFISKDFAAALGYTNRTSVVEDLCHELRLSGVLICAWGDCGACAKTPDRVTYLSEAYAPSKIVNTLGAGDTFVAATIISLMRGDSVGEALLIGCKMAGTKCGMPDIQGLAQLCPYLKS